MRGRFLISLSNQNNDNNDSTKFVYCKFGCGNKIKFDPERRSKNGILYPLNADETIHECPARNRGEWKPKIQRIDQDMGKVSPAQDNQGPILDEILKDGKKGREEHNQIGIDIYHVTNELEEIKQILKDLASKLPSSSFDGSRYR